MRRDTQIPELSLMLDSFILDCEARSLRPSTVEAYKTYNLWFLKFVGAKGVLRVEDVTAQHVRAYLVFLQGRGWKQTSIASVYRMLRVFFAFLVRDEVIDR